MPQTVEPDGDCLQVRPPLPAAPTGASYVARVAPAVRSALAAVRSVLAGSRAVPYAVFVVSVAWLATLEIVFHSRAKDGVHYQVWTSEDLQQTLPITMLRQFPLQSLYYLHIQPPLFDALRATIAQLVGHPQGAALVNAVDRWLYAVQALLFGLVSLRMYQWTRRLTDGGFALLLWLAWIIYPAPLFYASFLDSTFLSSCFMFLLFYELWRLPRPDGSIRRLAVTGLCVFFTRTVFQLYYIPVIALAMVLSRVGWRPVTAFVALSALGAIPWLAKQRILFGTFSTTSYSGYHQAGVIWYHPATDEIEAGKQRLGYRYPQAAKRYQGAKVANPAWGTGENLNTESVAVDNLVYSRLSAAQWATKRSDCIAALARSVRQNWKQFWLPYSGYSSHAIVDTLPWRKGYDDLFSGSNYQKLLLVGGLAWIWNWRSKWRRAGRRVRAVLPQLGRELGLCLVSCFIFATCMLANRYDWVEANRLKFFLDPLFFIFVATNTYQLVKGACSPFTRR